MVTQRQNDSTTGYKPAVLETKPKFLFLRHENLDRGTCGQPTTAVDSKSEDVLSPWKNFRALTNHKGTHTPADRATN